MMKKSFLLIPLLIFLGCSYLQGDYDIENPQSFFKDPHYLAYKDKRDALESLYLKKEISYSAYIEQRDALDSKYDQEVIVRENKIRSE